MKFKGMFLFVRGCFVQIWANKGRLLLTVTGIVLATILFLLSSVFINTYTRSLYDEANSCSHKGVLVTGNITQKLVSDLEIRYDSLHISRFQSPITSPTTSFSWNNMEISAMPIIVGTSANLFEGPVLSTQGIQSMYDSEIVSGRTISYDDIATRRKVVIISALAEDVFFGAESALNKTIDLSLTGLESDMEPYTVIGVYQNSYDEETVLHQLKNAIHKGMTSINFQLNCYVPESVIYNSVSERNVDAAVIATGTDISLKKQIQSYYRLIDSVEINYREAKIKAVDELNSDLLLFMHIIMIVMMFISGLNLFNSMMFSIRERVSEIGIRKAIGASEFDIVRQFLLEAVIVSIIGVAFAVVFVTLGATFFQIVVNRYSALDIDVILTWQDLLKAFCYILLMGTLFSVIPAIVAGKTNIIDAIRFD